MADDLHAVASHGHAAPHVLQVPLDLNQVDHRLPVHPVAVHDRGRLAQDRAAVDHQTRLKLPHRQQQPRRFQHKAI